MLIDLHGFDLDAITECSHHLSLELLAQMAVWAGEQGKPSQDYFLAGASGAATSIARNSGPPSRWTNMGTLLPTASLAATSFN